MGFVTFYHASVNQSVVQHCPLVDDDDDDDKRRFNHSITVEPKVRLTHTHMHAMEDMI